MTDDAPPTEPPSRLGRLLYSGILAYMAVDGFKNNEKRVDVARSQGVPLPELAVPLATGLLLVSNLGVLFWKFPRASLAGLVSFFLGTTPTIHSFWQMEGKERQQNKINFLKNVALLGGAVILLHEANDQADE
jgi:putative oxidoreductase